jgi:transposase
LIQINDKNIRDMAEIKTYDVIKNYAEDGKAAFAEQIYDTALKKFQNQINQKADSSLQDITRQQFDEIFD